MADHKGNTYCERINSAKIDTHTAQYVEQKQRKNCYNYHSQTHICAKIQEPQCKYAVDSLKITLGKTWNSSRHWRK